MNSRFILTVPVAVILLCLGSCRKTDAPDFIDIYAVGQHDSSAVYWRNGVMLHLGDSTLVSAATAIAVSGTDIYIVGYEIPPGSAARAMLWKNGVGSPLSSGTEASYANSIFFYGPDVYIAGEVKRSSGGTAAVGWVNGGLFTVSSSSESATATGMIRDATGTYVVGTTEEGSGGTPELLLEEWYPRFPGRKERRPDATRDGK